MNEWWTVGLCMQAVISRIAQAACPSLIHLLTLWDYDTADCMRHFLVSSSSVFIISTIPGIVNIFRKPRSTPWSRLKYGRWRERSPKNMPRNHKMFSAIFWQEQQDNILKGGKVIQECLANVITRATSICSNQNSVRFPHCSVLKGGSVLL